ncbi:MAG: HYR domain-containing protein [Bacteroidales bacterium]|nr:HYR domain-containing protein [Bacteroidales bacterium]
MRNIFTQSGQEIRTGKALPVLFFMGVILFASGLQEARAQAVLHSVGPTTICEGASTTMAVTIDGGLYPFTLIYTDGTNQFTVTPYDDEQLITVSPTITTTYTLVSIAFGSSPVQYLDDLSGSVTITVNPLPTNLSITVNPVSPVCPGVNFTISASATNGSTYELWNQANTVMISNLPYTTSIASATSYTVRAISVHSCTISQALTVGIDNVAPTISCPASQNLNTNAGSCSATLPDYRSGVTVSDNCTANGSITLTQNPAPGTVLAGGDGSTQLVTITATDASSNSNSCSFTITVQDVENPAITGTAVSGNKNTDAGQCYYTVSGTEFNPTSVTDNCGVLSTTYSVSGATTASGNNTMAGVQLSKGANIILWTATDINGNTNTWTFTITVVDNQNPQFTNCPANRDLNMGAGVCTAVLPNYITLLSVTTTDNCGAGAVGITQSPVAGTVLAGGDGSTQLITLTATDASGNSNTCTFTVTVQDTELPSLSCPAKISQNVDVGVCGAVVTYTAPVGTDNCGGANTIRTAGLASGATFPVGVTTNTFVTTDAAGNSTSCSFTVTVLDNVLPEITCPADITTSAEAGGCTATVTYTAPVGTDICAGAVTVQTAGLASGSSFPAGVTTNTFRVTDASGNEATCSFTVTVTDTEAPVISNCPSNISQSNDLNQCNAIVTWTEPTATDNCTSSGNLVWTKSHTPGSSFPVGTTTVTYTARDASNNSSVSCSFTVTVTDTQSPVISGCPSNITKSSDPGICTAIVSWTEPSATDNCTSSGNLVWTNHTPPALFLLPELRL